MPARKNSARTVFAGCPWSCKVELTKTPSDKTLGAKLRRWTGESFGRQEDRRGGKRTGVYVPQLRSFTWLRAEEQPPSIELLGRQQSDDAGSSRMIRMQLP